MISGQRNLHPGPGWAGSSEHSLMELFRQIALKFSKLYVAFKYQVYKFLASFLEGLQLPWFKLGLAALAVFIILKKDVQFSVNMRSPLSMAADQDEQKPGTDEMGLAQTVGWHKGQPSVIAPDELDEARVKAYVRRFTKVAVAEMEKYGMPASVKMAQGILESWAGEHPATRKNNNHFGSLLTGTAYNSAWENWRAHSQLLKESYPELFILGKSYKKWARGLEKAGYSPDKKYSRKLVDIIEKYQLYLLDEA